MRRLLMGLCVLAALASTTHAATFTIGGTTISVPDDEGRCAVNGSDPASRAWFEQAARAQQGVGNQLKLIVIKCSELGIVSGRGGQLSEWTMVYMSRRSFRVPPGTQHERYSGDFCRSMPGFIAKSGENIKNKTSSVLKEVYGRDLPTTFDKPFLYEDSCFMPLRSKQSATATVYGMFTPIVASDRLFFVSTYSYSSLSFPHMMRHLQHWSRFARGQAS